MICACNYEALESLTATPKLENPFLPNTRTTRVILGKVAPSCPASSWSLGAGTDTGIQHTPIISCVLPCLRSRRCVDHRCLTQHWGSRMKLNEPRRPTARSEDPGARAPSDSSAYTGRGGPSARRITITTTSAHALHIAPLNLRITRLCPAFHSGRTQVTSDKSVRGFREQVISDSEKEKRTEPSSGGNDHSEQCATIEQGLC